MTHIYYVKRWGSRRFRDPCRILPGRGRNGSILIEFADGHRMVTTRHGVRRGGAKC